MKLTDSEIIDSLDAVLAFMSEYNKMLDGIDFRCQSEIKPSV